MGTRFCCLFLLVGFTANAQLNSPQASWIRQYVSGNDPAFDFAYAIALDGSNNVIVVGSSR